MSQSKPPPSSTSASNTSLSKANSKTKSLHDMAKKSSKKPEENIPLSEMSENNVGERRSSSDPALERRRTDSLAPGSQFPKSTTLSKSQDLDKLEQWLNDHPTKEEAKGKDDARHKSKRSSVDGTKPKTHHNGKRKSATVKPSRSAELGQGAKPKTPQATSADPNKLSAQDVDASHSDASAGSSGNESMEKADEEAPDMYGSDRYEPSVIDTFGKLSIHDLPQVKAMKTKASKLMLRRMSRGASLVESQAIRQGHRKTLDLSQAPFTREVSSEEENGNRPEEVESSEDWDILDEEKSPSTSALPTLTESKPKLGLMTLFRVQNWVRQSRKVSVKTFAKSPEHMNLLITMANKFLIDTPIPVKLLMYRDLLPVLQATVHEYRHQLGRSHPMTIQAQKKIQSLQNEGLSVMEL